ncbi:unnamed protein product [Sphagnum troendelagicum]|uniref:Uncharacterized protein n=1 Tax=Sphagnum troendelagicum TaxID=128251 RepID=A0ABP0U9S2_9BRYO
MAMTVGLLVPSWALLRSSSPSSFRHGGHSNNRQQQLLLQRKETVCGNAGARCRKYKGQQFCGIVGSHNASVQARPRTVEKAAGEHKAERPDQKKKGVVITGGSKGLGYALAHQFLSYGHKVIICNRNEDQLATALQTLQAEHEGSIVYGMCCDVSNAADVCAFASFAVEKLGIVDIWINNAGEVTSKKILADVEASEIVRVCGTNVIGSLLCCREAINVMRLQPSSELPIFHIFNMGFSQWGANFTKSSCTHKTTKVALTQLTSSLSSEIQAAGLSSIGVHNLSPGMVLTDLLLKDSTVVARRFFNTLAEEPETVAASLAPRILAVQGTRKSISYLSPASAFLKVALGFPQIIQGGRFFDKNGNRVEVSGNRYQENGVRIR